mmetsp:Transcript_3059/g.6326  ORF Transcript_3059/g.6326 Transcript_3059/m.6326 type:complete len:93 (-) Transcript_3059:2289-2567(-)
MAITLADLSKRQLYKKTKHYIKYFKIQVSRMSNCLSTNFSSFVNNLSHRKLCSCFHQCLSTHFSSFINNLHIGSCKSRKQNNIIFCDFFNQT